MTLTEAYYPIAGAVGGAALIACFFWSVQRRMIAVEMFNTQVVKLVRANNRERAIKLCRAAPGCLYPDAVRSTLELWETAAREMRRLELEEHLRATFTRGLEQGVRRLYSWAWLGYLGLAASLGAVAWDFLRVRSPWLGWVIVVGSAAVAILGFTLRKAATEQRRGRAAFEQLLPAILELPQPE